MKVVPIHPDAMQAAQALNILDEAMQQRLQRLNAVSRRLRAMGYPVHNEEVAPDGGSAPLITLGALSYRAQAQLMDLADATTRRVGDGLRSACLDGVLVVWRAVHPTITEVGDTTPCNPMN